MHPRAAGQVILDVTDLQVSAVTAHKPLSIVRGVSLQVGAGEIFGLLGESGSGKSMTVQAINGLLPAGARVTGGSVKFNGEELIGASQRRLSQLRGQHIGMVFQDSLSSLNPIMRIGPQVAEPLLLHHKASRTEARRIAGERLRAMGIPDVDEAMRRFPHEFSGGMRQRATIATALMTTPQLLIADEPTTALDVTVQAQILDICRRLNAELGVAILLISHDLGVLSEICTRIGVMYAGQIIQTGPTRSLLEHPNHPYTRALVQSMPRTGTRSARLKAIGGEPPAPSALPPGCKFHPRCAFTIARCRTDEPTLEPVGDTRSACWVAQSGGLPPLIDDDTAELAEPAQRNAGSSDAGHRHSALLHCRGRGPVRPTSPCSRRGWRFTQHSSRRNSGDRGRIRLRQIDPRTLPAPSDRRRGRRHRVHGPGRHSPQRR